MKERLCKEFEQVFGPGGEICTYFAPGRVNLIGEHTDYNGGHVFPCALTIGTYAAVRPNTCRSLRLYSSNFPQKGIREVPLDRLDYREEDDWCNYPKGMAWVFAQEGKLLPEGLDILYLGDLPNRSGLSSSASIEVLTGYIFLDRFGWQMDGVTLALLAQRAENQYNGVNCGIMDQFAVAMGKQNHAIFLDTADLSYEYVPVLLDHMKLVIACSNKKRGLADSKYNERRRECETALQMLRRCREIPSLGALTLVEFEELSGQVTDPVLQRRARHAVSENQRTVDAVRALRAGQIREFGKLMNASHKSLRDDYEVTGFELDTLAETAWKQPGVIGSRMTGAGFGGCTISLVEEDAVEEFTRNVGAAYQKAVGYCASFYAVGIGSGPRRLD